MAAVQPMTLEGTQSASERPGRYDSGLRRRSQRHGNEKGCRVNIPAEELRAAGFDPNGPVPFYRTHGFQRSKNAGTIIVSLYREP